MPEREDRDDRELLTLLQVPAGRDEAFRALSARHAPRLLGFLRTYFRDASTAEDLLQQVFLALLQTPPSGADLDLWLLRTARHRALDEKRRQRSRPTISEVPERPAPAEGGPSEMEDRLRRAIETLPETYREILVLHRFKGLKYGAIAGILGTTPESCRVMMHKALEILRKNISESG